MDYQKFYEWLLTEKRIGERSARDVISRIRRVLLLIGENEITLNTLQHLNKTDNFETFTRCIKSQLKRSVALYNEFQP